VGVLTRHLMESNKYASWTLLLGLWAPGRSHELLIGTVAVGGDAAKGTGI